MLYWLSPLRPPRRACGSVTGLQTATLTLTNTFVLTRVVLGHELLLAGGIAIALAALILGAPAPRFAERLAPAQDGGTR
ncbi:hypothetical protein [Amycolatopsis regifaucium]|uniref:Uncharacterized protein n=1 Tax=Amycolatopsis regifaucium TaxID=546365 RepID=A0A154MN08_9PSEU|nr:hypothetical protein [Amycolatopsis regifaucium]KZB84789.1 hypothetical protein AVL48_31790 [Amycolatopsis regifaucium]OKA05229.1 hypothetical protein ATP06_0227085 [Amycolatopsis regifaucium]SFJ64243.1 hypothetical protein SAMN04489731_12845 [Amycolatopsis regifaucium]